MRKWVALWVPLVVAAVAVVAVPASSEAGWLFRRHRQCYCPPSVCVPCPPTAFAPAPVPLPTRMITTPKGRVIRLTLTGDHGNEHEEPGVLEAKVGPDDFSRVSRKKAKTSYVEGEATVYESVSELKASLVPEEVMLALEIPYGRGSQESDRVEQEKRNVTVTGYIYAYKNEDDHDYHLMVGDAPDSPNRQFMNMEVSGLPLAGPHREKLEAVRTKFKTFFNLGTTGPRSYEDLDNPQRVRITGSLFFDMDHSPPHPLVEHDWMKPGTAWEVHPITDIEFDPHP